MDGQDAGCGGQRNETAVLALNPLYHQVKFLYSAARLSQAPPDSGCEVAFAGRSNAGKSSAINVLCGQKGLARISNTPGRTQLLNFFRLDEQRRLVDLPGYGYAKVPERVKLQWQREMAAYLEQRRSLRGVVLVMDIRRPLTDYDEQMLNWGLAVGLNIHILLAKADKLGRGSASSTLLRVRGSLHGARKEVGVQLFSAPKHQGIEDAHRVLDRWLCVGEVLTPAAQH